MGWIAASDGNWSRAEGEFKEAIRLQRDNALAHHWYALLLVTLDRREEALAEIGRAKQLDPTSQLINGANMMIEFYNGVKLPLGNPGNAKKIRGSDVSSLALRARRQPRATRSLQRSVR